MISFFSEEKVHLIEALDTYYCSIRHFFLEMNLGHFNIDLQCLGFILFVNVFAKLGLFCLHIEPFNVTSLKKNRKVRFGKNQTFGIVCHGR